MTRHRRRGLHILGAAVSNADYGPLSPAQLAMLDRALTPAEQKAVDDWQSRQAGAAQAAEEAKGGPKATATIAPSGGRVTASPTYTPPVQTSARVPAAEDDGGRPWWHYAIAAAVVATAVGIGASVAS